jgi:hypothetical protein
VSEGALHGALVLELTQVTAGLSEEEIAAL